MASTSIFVVSACLLGLKTRYDCKCEINKECLDLAKQALLIPVCPEQLGGLPTPRTAAHIVGGDGLDVLSGKAKVVTRSGCDVTSQFVTGAHQVLKIAQMQNVGIVYLKSKSPSCGVNNLGVTAALLKEHGFELREF